LRLALALAVLASPALAQQCAERDVIRERLADQHGETVQTRALGDQGRMVETYANLDTGSWTTVVTRGDMVACIVAHGQAFSVVSEALGDDV